MEMQININSTQDEIKQLFNAIAERRFKVKQDEIVQNYDKIKASHKKKFNYIRDIEKKNSELKMARIKSRQQTLLALATLFADNNEHATLEEKKEFYKKLLNITNDGEGVTREMSANERFILLMHFVDINPKTKAISTNFKKSYTENCIKESSNETQNLAQMKALRGIRIKGMGFACAYIRPFDYYAKNDGSKVYKSNVEQARDLMKTYPNTYYYLPDESDYSEELANSLMGDLCTITSDFSIANIASISSSASVLYNGHNELGLHDKQITYSDFDEYFRNRVESNALSIALDIIKQEKKDKPNQNAEEHQ